MKRLFSQLRQQRKPRVLFLVDYRGWAYDHSAKALASELADEFEFEIKYVTDTPKPILKANRYDLINVFFWGETYHQQYGFSSARTIKTVSSHRWEDDPRFGPCTASEMVDRFLRDSETVICTSERLFEIMSPYHRRTFHTPNGIDTSKFRRVIKREGSIKFGWAGNIEDRVKGVDEILLPACAGLFNLITAPGQLSHNEMNLFYNRLDVLAIASKHEGEPLTLIEAMAAGCFPVCSDVGIVTELITHEKNGLIVNERTPSSFREAFKWCESNAEYVRKAGIENATEIRRTRNWGEMAKNFKSVFNDALAHATSPSR